MCDRLGLDPGDVHYVQGDTDQVFIGEGTGGSRSATIGGAAVDMAADKITAKGKQIAAHLLKVDAAEVNFADGVFSSPKTNRTLTIKEVAKEATDPAKLPKGMDVGLIATATYVAPVQNFPNGCHICELEIDQDTGSVEIVRYSVVDDVGTVLNPLLLKGQIVGGVAQGVGQILMEDIQFDGDGQTPHGLVHGLCHAARDRHQRGRGRRAIRCRPGPIRSASRARAKPAASAPCPRSPTRWSTRCPISASVTSRCRRRRSGCGGRSKGRMEVGRVGKIACRIVAD